MFQIIECKHKQTVPVTGTDTIYAGQLVKWAGEGVSPLGVASGAYDTTNESIIAGVVISTNNVRKTYHDGTTIAGYSGEEITGVVTQANMAAAIRFGNSGMYPKGSKLAMAEIGIITAETRIKGRFYNAAYGTAPTLLTATVGSTTGLGCTTNAADVAGVADFSTIYNRKGANAGEFRVTDDSSTTVHTQDHPFAEDIAVGDTFVKIFGKQGFARLQFDANSLYINVAAVTSSYYGVFIEQMNLETAAQEYCIFRFISKHLGTPIA